MGLPYMDEDCENIYCCGTPVVVTEDEDGYVVVSFEGGEPLKSSMYSLAIWGGENTIEKGSMDFKRTSITVNAGVFASVIGGNKGPGTIDSVNIIINDGYLDSVDAGSGYNSSVIPGWTSPEQGECHIKESNITMNGGYVWLLYGGTSSGIATVDKTNLVVTGGEVDWLTCGNSNGVCKHATGKISGDVKVNKSLAGGNRGTVGRIDMEVTGGEFELVSVMGDATGSLTGDANVDLFGGTVKQFAMFEDIEITPETKMDGVKVRYATGVINEEDIANAPVEIKKDDTKGEGAEMKTIRVYPFPHQSDRIFGVLIEGLPLDRPSELPMSEQEIRMCLGMGQLFEVFEDKLVLLEEANYNKDNSKAPEYTGELPCEDCELVYPRGKKEDVPVGRSVRKSKKATKKSSREAIPERGLPRKTGSKVGERK